MITALDQCGRSHWLNQMKQTNFRSSNSK